MNWREYKQELIAEGLYESFVNPIDEEVIINTKCDECDYESLHPVAFRGDGRYLVFGICLNCGYYIEV